MFNRYLVDNRQLSTSVLKKYFTRIKRSLSTKGAVSGPRQFLTTESPLKMMRNAF